MNDHNEWKQLVSAYFDDELSPEEKDTVNNHLVDCPACQTYLKELKTLSLSIKALKNETLSPDLEQRLNQTRTERPSMNKSKFLQVMKTVTPVFVIVFLSVMAMQNYAQRAIQGRMRSAADNIGDQYSAGNTNFRKTVLVRSETKDLGKTTQYEPYYTSSSYEVSKDLKGGSVNYASKIALSTSESRLRAKGVVGTSYDTSGLIREISAPAAVAGAVFGGKASQLKKKGDKAITWNDTASTVAPRAPTFASNGMDDMADRLSRQRPNSTDKNVLYSGQIKEEESQRANKSVQNRSDSAYFLAPPIYAPASVATTDGERYDLITENEFLDATQNPLSTFSIDVDTASYSNIRRFLSNGQMPPKDSVRIEEMINYFDYKYPAPTWNNPFSITLEQGPCPWNTSHQLVLVGLQGKTIADNQTPESNLVFLIDVSGSMNEPDKLPLLKESLKMMVTQLRPQERVSMVVYAGSAGLVLDSTPGYDKQAILSAIDRLSAGGSTAGGQGIQLAYQIAKKNFIRNGNNRVILATDGDFNVGVSSDAELVRIIEEERKSGIFLTVLGFGTGNLQDAKMEKLADKGNGNYFYIDNINEGKKVLVDELGSTILTIAKDVKIQIEFNPAHVKEYRLVGYENRKLAKEDFNDDTKDAGELGAGHTVTALYEIVPAGTWESHGNVDPLKYQKQTTKKSIFTNENEMMTVKLRYKEPNSDTSRLITQVLNRPGYTFGKVWYGPSDNLSFASAVAEFGMLLRDSKFKGNSTYQDVIQRAQTSAYTDNWGYKGEFIGLVQRASSLDPNQYQNVVPVQQPDYNQGQYYNQYQQPQGYNQKQ